MEDTALIDSAREGSNHALRALYESHKEKIYALAFRYTRNKEDAEDVLQDTFIKAFNGLDQFNNQSGTPGEKETIAVDAVLLKNLLLQNYVLKQMVAEEDPQAAQMLEDLELVLREIINRSEDDPAAPDMIRDLINQRDILFKMDVLREI